MTKDELIVECVNELTKLRDHVTNHPDRVSAIDRILAQAQALEMPEIQEKPTGFFHKLMGDRRGEERDPGEHEQHVAEEMGYADK